MAFSYQDIAQILGENAPSLLEYKSYTFAGQSFYHPNPNFVEEVFAQTDRSEKVQNNLKRLYSSGRLADTGYLSILPVDQGIEHSAGASFAKNPMYFDPANILKLAVEGGCNGVATTVGALRQVTREYADKIPLIAKLNHNETLSFPNKFEQVMFGNVQQAVDMGAAGIGVTLYFGAENSSEFIPVIAETFAEAHRAGLFTVLWCYLRNSAFKQGDKDYHVSADLTAQANHLGASLGADIIKQKIPTVNGGYKALQMGNTPYGKFDERIYTELTTNHPIDWVKYQVANCYMGRVPMISSGGPSGDYDLRDAVMSAVINKRAGGSGLILGRKAFQKPFAQGLQVLHAVQDVYLCKDITLA